jgi:diguanylate cyclase (GGDEF)-like protein
MTALGLLAVFILTSIFLGNNPSIIKYVNADEPAIVAEEAIRVGFCKVEGFISYDEDGNFDGYYVDYLRRIAQITGWNYAYVQLDNMEQGRNMLANHEIDLLAPCRLDMELMEQFEYSQYSFGTEYYVLVAKTNNSDIYYEDYDGMDGKDIGTLETLSSSDSLDDYMEDNGFKANVIYYENINVLNTAFKNGDIDLIWIPQMMTDDSEKIVARFSPYPFYFMTWRGNDEMLNDLNNAMQNLKNTYPGLENELLTTYFPKYNIIYFSRAEQEFIDTLQPIKVAYLAENTPISFTNAQGEFDGISRGIFDKIEEVSGLTFEYEMLPEGDITYDYLREKGFDLITGVRYNKSNLYSRGILLTNPYLSSKMVLVGKEDEEFDTNENYKVAVVAGSQTLNNEIVVNFPNFTVVNCDTVEECLESVRKGKTDLMMTDRYIANYWLTRPLYDKLYVMPVDGLTDELCFSAVVDIYGTNTLSGLNGVELVSIINKTLSQISQDEIEEIIINENNSNRYVYTLDDFLYTYRFAVYVGIIVIAVSIIIYMYIQNLKNKARKIHENESRKIATQNKRYQMMMDSSGEMLYDMGINGENGFISEQIKKKFGWSIPDRITEFTEDSVMELFHIHPEDWKSECSKVSDSINTVRAGTCNVRIMSQSGEMTWCRIYFYPFVNEENNLMSIIGKIEDIDEEIKERNKLRHENQTDRMTGVLNKQAFEQMVKAQLLEKTSLNSAIVFVDLDHFKNLNDTLGHSIGDTAIKEAAARLQVLFANVDLVSRFGGDEFCVFVWNIPKHKLIDKLERLIATMHKTYTDKGESVLITASVGAIYSINTEADFNTMFNLADNALYEAKENGRNQYVLKEI